MSFSGHDDSTINIVLGLLLLLLLNQENHKHSSAWALCRRSPRHS